MQGELFMRFECLRMLVEILKTSSALAKAVGHGLVRSRLCCCPGCLTSQTNSGSRRQWSPSPLVYLQQQTSCGALRIVRCTFEHQWVCAPCDFLPISSDKKATHRQRAVF